MRYMVGYSNEAPSGERETAYQVSLLDGQQAAVVELNAARMILFATGNLFYCLRGN
jgi:hypothetical protein